MSKEAIEKDIRSLEAQNRTMRNKNADLVTEHRRLFNANVQLKEDAQVLQKHIDVLRYEKAALGDLKKKATIEAREIVERAKDVENEAKKLWDDNCKKDLELSERKIALDVIEETKKKEMSALKKEREQITGKLKDLDACKDKLAQEKEKVTKAWQHIREAQHDLRNEEKRVEKCKADAEANLTKSQELKTIVENKAEQVESILVDFRTQKDINCNLEKQLSASKEDYAIKIKEVNNLRQEIELKRKGLDRISSELSLREKELEIKRLRMEKLIKEKGIAEELRKLEEELRK